MMGMLVCWLLQSLSLSSLYVCCGWVLFVLPSSFRSLTFHHLYIDQAHFTICEGSEIIMTKDEFLMCKLPQQSHWSITLLSSTLYLNLRWNDEMIPSLKERSPRSFPSIVFEMISRVIENAWLITVCTHNAYRGCCMFMRRGAFLLCLIHAISSTEGNFHQCKRHRHFSS